jgi:hypothetical protein
MKRIHSIKIERVEDKSPDTSYLGTFDVEPKSEFAIDRTHETQVARYRYFNPATVEPYNALASWIPAKITGEARRAYWLEAMTKNARADYERYLAFKNDEWYYVGVRASASIVINDIAQTLTSSVLYGIESDSDKSYFDEIGAEELAELRGILHTAGFSKRAIAKAMKDSNL